MNKKIMKVMSILLIFIMIVSTMSSMVFALTPGEVHEGEVETDAITSLGGNIIAVLRTVGIVLSVIVLIIIGIKYMMGSPEDKSEYKKSMMPYIIGAALIFAASIFADVIYGFFNGLNS